jgi:hypothetical protein
MTIEAAFLDLRRKFEALVDAFEGLALTAIEDRPARGEVLLVERLGNVVDDLRGLAAEGREAAGRASDALADPADLNLGRRALVLANERFLRLEHRFFAEAVSHATMSGLLDFAQERGRDWRAWAATACKALEACRTPLHELDEAMLLAWAELGERLGGRSVTVQAHSVGQQITTPAAAKRATPHRASSRVREGLA